MRLDTTSPLGTLGRHKQADTGRNSLPRQYSKGWVRGGRGDRVCYIAHDPMAEGKAVQAQLVTPALQRSEQELTHPPPIQPSPRHLSGGGRRVLSRGGLLVGGAGCWGRRIGAFSLLLWSYVDWGWGMRGGDEGG